MKNFRLFFAVFFSNYFQSSTIFQNLMIVSEKLPQSLSDYIQFLFTKRFEYNKKRDYFY